jgi:hypothetical protein
MCHPKQLVVFSIDLSNCSLRKEGGVSPFRSQVVGALHRLEGRVTVTVTVIVILIVMMLFLRV